MPFKGKKNVLIPILCFMRESILLNAMWIFIHANFIISKRPRFFLNFHRALIFKRILCSMIEGDTLLKMNRDSVKHYVHRRWQQSVHTSSFTGVHLDSLMHFSCIAVESTSKYFSNSDCGRFWPGFARWRQIRNSFSKGM